METTETALETTEKKHGERIGDNGDSIGENNTDSIRDNG